MVGITLPVTMITTCSEIEVDVLMRSRQHRLSGQVRAMYEKAEAAKAIVISVSTDILTYLLTWGRLHVCGAGSINLILENGNTAFVKDVLYVYGLDHKVKLNSQHKIEKAEHTDFASTNPIAGRIPRLPSLSPSEDLLRGCICGKMTTAKFVTKDNDVVNTAAPLEQMWFDGFNWC
ncbi:uncharacterized protein PHALS_07841 [Plasmopara halstedii]|uniref:Uncharacterized protein n=1 Tax=Plasmopara halstedii TaxID=4781 RepID=A0A0N7L8K3_PLAHL|nr:uncharacterized protein PHALS_07841 [Plasmopara halstedii]CEG50115.1 hypothetical protein PHALS_07841 [Plasmopara halstedii]|eukprot:XP_024586484.1 hypothetical protein PHALS_07841 [Plasmopara halstedii]